ncbi:hypothetical protein EVAR_5127_1 [Eumeta japonica]|uniref:Uncharacterized protein n=1 Tax=Eumeta variegata TaxID=151549 RepID=A0A4C1SXU2_EUMVA|nr:hypothetical protein EVAR_5127_1 [Eumeta japonica]
MEATQIFRRQQASRNHSNGGPERRGRSAKLCHSQLTASDATRKSDTPRLFILSRRSYTIATLLCLTLEQQTFVHGAAQAKHMSVSDTDNILISYGILLCGNAANVYRIFVLQKRADRAVYKLGPPFCNAKEKHHRLDTAFFTRHFDTRVRPPAAAPAGRLTKHNAGRDI